MVSSYPGPKYKKVSFSNPGHARNLAKKLNKLDKVNESITVNRYDNGFMVEVGGRDKENDWKTAKVLCATEAEMLDVVKEWNTMEIDT